MVDISGYHAHVYFDADRRDQAREPCETAGKRLPLIVGRLHDTNPSDRIHAAAASLPSGARGAALAR